MPRSQGNFMRHCGFTYIAVLFLVAIMGAVLAGTATVWHTLVQRDKEQELLYVGHEFRRAIGLYYERTPGAAKQFPKKLEDLIEDKRQTNVTRYLRKRYIDPMTANKKWGLVPGPDGTVMGVYSLSDALPIKTGSFDQTDKEFDSKTSYQDWKFTYIPFSPSPPPSQNPAPVALPPPPASQLPAPLPEAPPSLP
jgi:type II secretory pathway pseudopilin PulG